MGINFSCTLQLLLTSHQQFDKPRTVYYVGFPNDFLNEGH